MRFTVINAHDELNDTYIRDNVSLNRVDIHPTSKTFDGWHELAAWLNELITPKA